MGKRVACAPGQSHTRQPYRRPRLKPLAPSARRPSKTLGTFASTGFQGFHSPPQEGSKNRVPGQFFHIKNIPIEQKSIFFHMTRTFCHTADVFFHMNSPLAQMAKPLGHMTGRPGHVTKPSSSPTGNFRHMRKDPVGLKKDALGLKKVSSGPISGLFRCTTVVLHCKKRPQARTVDAVTPNTPDDLPGKARRARSPSTAVLNSRLDAAPRVFRDAGRWQSS